MKKSIYLVVTACMALSLKGYGASASFDDGVDASGLLQQAKTSATAMPDQHGGQPGRPGPDRPGPDRNHPGPDGNHDGDHRGPNWDHDHGYGPDHDRPAPYEAVFPDMNCVSWQFTAQTPNTKTDKVTGEEMSADCYTDPNGQMYCRPTGNYYSRTVTVNIGARQLESWDTEMLKICLDDANSTPRLDLTGMLYDYAVASKDSDGFLGFGKSSTITLTPGAKKPAQPTAAEISVASVQKDAAGSVSLVLSDARADYYKGGTIDISMDGMHLVDKDAMANMTPDQLIKALAQFQVPVQNLPVAPSYTLKMVDNAMPGQYVVTIRFIRHAANAQASEVSTITTVQVQ